MAPQNFSDRLIIFHVKDSKGDVKTTKAQLAEYPRGEGAADSLKVGYYQPGQWVGCSVPGVCGALAS